MDAMEHALVGCGLEFACADWFVACPFHHASELRPYHPPKQAGYGDVEARLAFSMCVVNSVQSTKHALEGK
eukprot:14607353-Alexandrium_andersonii.AAC.1